MDELHELAKRYIQQGHRAGQAYINALADIDGELARRVGEEGVDPFYDDDLLPQFFDYIREYF